MGPDSFQAKKMQLSWNLPQTLLTYRLACIGRLHDEHGIATPRLHVQRRRVGRAASARGVLRAATNLMAPTIYPLHNMASLRSFVIAPQQHNNNASGPNALRARFPLVGALSLCCVRRGVRSFGALDVDLKDTVDISSLLPFGNTHVSTFDSGAKVGGEILAGICRAAPRRSLPRRSSSSQKKWNE